MTASETVTAGACPLCGSRALASLPRPRRTIGGALGALPGLGLVRCRGCGFELVDPRPSDAALAAFYQAQDYTAHEPVDDHAAQRRARGQLDAIARAGGRLRGAAVLDIGCGGGQLLALARARGARPCGVDVAAHAHAACAAQGIEVVDRLDALGDRRFDGIVMSHVLEHVPDVPALLAQCRAALAPDGWLCIEVPNIASLRARWSPPALSRLGADERHRAFPIHLSYFAPATLRRALAGAGFTIAAMTTAGLGIDALVPRRGAPEPIAPAAAPPPRTAAAPPHAPAAAPPSRTAAAPPSRSAAAPPSRSAAALPSRTAAALPPIDPAPPPSRTAAPPPSRAAAAPPSIDPVPPPPPGARARVRALLKQAYFGRLLGENLITIARPR